ncbi:hypothetical protein B0I72DRAFT_141696 [Yarrowia lipolytica]|jgi:hypothetical protein|uniref:YALI0A13321p n=2 Tax=Yarrowia lipolytica TaxID=4952 RepID=Q6CH26_YARLI|nr:YALI0A13321p [Yarrowia lipolytica CLIB122]AOW00599.1 hypothetical protein YALI1_A13412g [Yarrowia lipolytica]KAB8283268.1 hypothetical protein BKA91DRAFT_137107 [Yarrowia lipolytica]KAE8174061.1 hypothetical protein BKA90DRAFT_134730 [Yarrowia lipolytica]KAJ8051638.1 hypothetical protein LXG23DRAFT_26315 [Yarrowia lipolytica]QNP95210.1 UPF0662 protein [Yarrowia lipolytica]|eukprot:XP_500036.1 YALI0A13321p [Yarrowia lipolytica CLIB122]
MSLLFNEQNTHKDDTVPANEKEMLSKLVALRDQLTALKLDRQTYLKQEDISRIYNQVVEEVSLLNQIRSDPSLEDEYNRVDVVLDDVFQLLSLSFLTIGHNKSAAATYASLSTVRRLLSHLKESQIYTGNDYEPVRARLDEIQAILKQQSEENPEVIALIERELKVCMEGLKEVEEAYNHVIPEVGVLLQKVYTIRREIMSVASTPDAKDGKRSVATELQPLLKQLQNIEKTHLTGEKNEFITSSGEKLVDKSAGLLAGQIDDCFELIKDFEAETNRVDPSLLPVYSELLHLKTTLEGLTITHRWTMRETDLYGYQKKLQAIDERRVGGLFVPEKDKDCTTCDLADSVNNLSVDDKDKNDKKDSLDKEGSPTKLAGQSILLYLLRRCYALIYKLLESSEPISEALTPLHNQLKTMRRFLLDIKRLGGISSVRELYPYQLKLRSIDNQRVDGKFMQGNSIPEGQGMVNALLAECFDICHELQVDYENEEEDDNNEDEDDEDETK